MKSTRVFAAGPIILLVFLLAAGTLLTFFVPASPAEAKRGDERSEACAALPTEAVSWWRGEGNADDVLSNNGGSPQGGISFTSGKVGQAFSLDGVDDHIVVPDSPSLTPVSGLTVDAWINPSSGSHPAPGPVYPGYRSIISKYDTSLPGAQNSFAFFLTPDNRLVFAVYNPGSIRESSTAIQLPNNQFTHVAATFDLASQQIRIFVNGVDSGSPASGGQISSIFDSSSSVRIGSLKEGNTLEMMFFGELDEVDLFSRALPSQEIQAIFNAGAEGKCLQTGTPTPTPTPTPEPACEPLPSNTVSWWKGEGNANDVLGSNNGSLENGTTFVAGKVGQAFGFDGVNDQIGVPDQDSLDITGDLTIEGWINPTSVGGQQRTIASKRNFDNSAATYALFIQTNGKLAFYSKNGESFQFVESQSAISANVFSHVAGSITGNQLRLSVNGVAEPPVILNVVRVPTSGRFVIGHGEDNTSASDYFAGLIDELTVYNRGLSSAEIQAIYNARSAGKCLSSGTPTPSPSPSPSITPTPTPEVSPTPTPTPTPSPSPSPDLRIVSFTTGGSPPFEEGTIVQLSATVLNSGNLRGRANVAFYYDVIHPANLIHVEQGVALEPNQQQTINTNWNTAGFLGLRDLFVRVENEEPSLSLPQYPGGTAFIDDLLIWDTTPPDIAIRATYRVCSEEAGPITPTGGCTPDRTVTNKSFDRLIENARTGAFINGNLLATGGTVALETEMRTDVNANDVGGPLILDGRAGLRLEILLREHPSDRYLALVMKNHALLASTERLGCSLGSCYNSASTACASNFQTIIHTGRAVDFSEDIISPPEYPQAVYRRYEPRVSGFESFSRAGIGGYDRSNLRAISELNLAVVVDKLPVDIATVAPQVADLGSILATNDNYDPSISNPNIPTRSVVVTNTSQAVTTFTFYEPIARESADEASRPTTVMDPVCVESRPLPPSAALDLFQTDCGGYASEADSQQRQPFSIVSVNGIANLRSVALQPGQSAIVVIKAQLPPTALVPAPGGGLWSSRSFVGRLRIDTSNSGSLWSNMIVTISNGLATPTPTPTPGSSPTPTASPTPTVSPSPTVTPTPGPTPTPTPTPGFVSIEGRILTPSGLGVRSAVVTLIDTNGNRQTATTGSFGFYSFANLPNGQTYTLTVRSNRYRFTPRVLMLTESVRDLNFIGLE